MRAIEGVYTSSAEGLGRFPAATEDCSYPSTEMSNTLAPVGGAAMTRPRERPGFTDGIGALLSGFGFVIGRPSVWPLAFVPVAVGTAMTVLFGWIVLRMALPAIAHAFGPHVPVLRTAVEILVVVLIAPVAALIGFGVAQPLSGPALNRIVRRVEGELGAPPWPATGFLEDVGRALHSIAIAYLIGLPVLAVLYAVTLAFPAATVVTFPLKLVVLAMMTAWDLCDYPLSIHGMPIGRRVAFVTRNLRAMIGFGVGLGLISLVPFAMLLVLPAGVAGAARLTRRIEMFEGR
jgi:CysZ protein